jgi:hypothetical protein
MVTHKGKVVGVALDDKNRFWYTVMGDTGSQLHTGKLDVEAWPDSDSTGKDGFPRLLPFPNEIQKVGHAAVGNQSVPKVKSNGKLVTPQELAAVGTMDLNNHLSTTSRFTDQAPFKLISDNQHIYVFRQSVAGNNDTNLFTQFETSDVIQMSIKATRFDPVNNSAYNAGAAEVKIGGDTHSITSRGHNLLVFDRNSMELLEQQNFDTYSDSVGQCAAFKEKIESLNTRCLVVVASYDACSMTIDLRDAMKYCGGSGKGVDQRGRHVHFMVGIPGSEPNSMFESYKSGSTKSNQKSDNRLSLQLLSHAGDIYNRTGNGSPESPFKVNLPMIAEPTVLLDRFLLQGDKMALCKQVRFKRSRNETFPAPGKDSLGTKDMNGLEFYEPTHELTFIKCRKGRFTINLLPTNQTDITRWQFFAHNPFSRRIDSFNVERHKDGLINTHGTVVYTSPDPKYQSSVHETTPGECPYTSLPMIPILSPPEYAESCLRFDGEGDCIEIGVPTNYNMNDSFTVEAWVMPERSSKDEWVLGNVTGRGKNKTAAFGFRDGKAHFGFHSDDLSGTQTVPTDQWVHIAFTYEQTTKKRKIYINGILDSQDVATADYGGHDPLYIGNYDNRYFKGIIDEMRIWNHCRSKSQLDMFRDHRLVGDEPGLSGYFRFDEAAGDALFDQSENPIHGVIRGNPQWIDSTAPVSDHPGMRRSSFSFSNRYIPDWEDGGMDATLYSNQVPMKSDDGTEKPMKQKPRLMLALSTRGPDVMPPIQDGLLAYQTAESLNQDRWNDLSGKNNHMVIKAGSITKIDIEQNERSFQAVKIPDGADLRYPDTANLNGDHTIFLVDKDFPGADRTLGSVDTHEWLLGLNNGHNRGWHINQSGKSTAQWVGNYKNPAAQNTIALTSAILSGTTGTCHVNGESMGSEGGVAAPGRLCIGEGQKAHNNTKFDGAEVLAVLIYDRALNDEERKIMESWIGDRFGILECQEDSLENKTYEQMSMAMPGSKMAKTLRNIQRPYILSIDFGISDNGRLALVPDTLSPKHLLSADPLGGQLSRLLDELDEKTQALPAIENQIDRLEGEVDICNDRIKKKNVQVVSKRVSKTTLSNSLNTKKKELKRAKEQLTKAVRVVKDRLVAIKKTRDSLAKKRNVKFYDSSNKTGSYLSMKTGESKSSLSGWNDRISSINWPSKEVVITAYEHSNFGGKKSTFYGGNSASAWTTRHSSGWWIFKSHWTKNHGDFQNNSFSSIKIYRPWNYSLMIAYCDLQIVVDTAVLNKKSTAEHLKVDSLSTDIRRITNKLEAIDQEIRILLNEIADVKVERDAKVAEWNMKKLELASAEQAIILAKKAHSPSVPPLPLSLVHVDPAGLTISAGLMGFAWSSEAPTINESASGKLILYFKGKGDQIFSAYYDINSSRVRIEVDTKSGSGEGAGLGLIARSLDREFDDASAIITDGSSSETCTLVISNPAGFQEKWNDMPRDAIRFARILNGIDLQPHFIGRTISEPGASITTLKVDSPTSYLLKKGFVIRTLSGDKLTVSTDTPYGSNEISVETYSLSTPVGTEAVAMGYDIDNTVVPLSMSLGKGSLTFLASGSANGDQVKNGSYAMSSRTKSAKWVGDEPGQSLWFDGRDDVLTADPIEVKHFKRKKDLTMEAWVNPEDLEGRSTVIHKENPDGGYGIHLHPAAKIDGMQFDGSSWFEVTNSNSLWSEKYTIEGWIKIDEVSSNSTWEGIFGRGFYSGQGRNLMLWYNRTGRYLHHCNWVLRSNKTDSQQKNTTHNSEFGSIDETSWIHYAIVDDGSKRTSYINGEKMAEQDISGTRKKQSGIFQIGATENTGFNGCLSDLRIWSKPKSQKGVKRDMYRDLSGDESGLLANFTFNSIGQCIDKGPKSYKTNLKVHSGEPADSRPVPCNGPKPHFKVEARISQRGKELHDALVSTELFPQSDWHQVSCRYKKSFGVDMQQSGSHIKVKHDDELNIAGNLTLEMKVKLDNVGKKQGLISKGSTLGDNRTQRPPFMLYIDSSDRVNFSYCSNESKDSGSNVTDGELISTFRSSARLSNRKAHTISISREFTTAEFDDTVREFDDSKQGYKDVTKKVDKSALRVRIAIDGVVSPLDDFLIEDPIHVGKHSGDLLIGRSATPQSMGKFQDGGAVSLDGSVLQVFLMTSARKKENLGKPLDQDESAMAFWPMEEGEGTLSEETISSHNGILLSGATWISNPDPSMSGFEVLVNGSEVSSSPDVDVPPVKAGLVASYLSTSVDNEAGSNISKIFDTSGNRRHIQGTAINGTIQQRVRTYNGKRTRMLQVDTTDGFTIPNLDLDEDSDCTIFLVDSYRHASEHRGRSLQSTGHNWLLGGHGGKNSFYANNWVDDPDKRTATSHGYPVLNTASIETNHSREEREPPKTTELEPGLYRIWTTYHKDGKQPKDWGLACFPKHSGGYRNGSSSWVHTHSGGYWPMTWKVEKGKKAGTYRILTTAHAGGQVAGWGLSAWNAHGAKRNGSSSWIAVHSGEKWPMDWVIKPNSDGTHQILTTHHPDGHQSQDWGLASWNAHGAKRNGSSSRVAVHSGTHWPMKWRFERMDKPVPKPKIIEHHAHGVHYINGAMASEKADPGIAIPKKNLVYGKSGPKGDPPYYESSNLWFGALIVYDRVLDDTERNEVERWLGEKYCIDGLMMFNGKTQFSVGGRMTDSSSNSSFSGEMEEVRIWNKWREKEQLMDNLFTRLKKDNHDLIAYYPFDDGEDSTTRDRTLRGLDLEPAGNKQIPIRTCSTAPIHDDLPIVRSSLTGMRSRFHRTCDSAPCMAEYGDIQILPDGTKIGVHKRVSGYIHKGQWKFNTGFKIGDLKLEWLSQVQFAPQVMGFIEGAPPVPSENLGPGPVWDNTGDFDEASKVSLIQEDTLIMSTSKSREDGFDLAIEGKVGGNVGLDVYGVIAPLGFGMSVQLPMSFDLNFGFQAEYNYNKTWSSSQESGLEYSRSRTFESTLTGAVEHPDHRINPDKALPPRFQPINQGFALVQSETADVYAMRLTHNGALVGLSIQPNPDIPKDWNIISFPINPRYTKQGTLDGKLGFSDRPSELDKGTHVAGVVKDPDYPSAEQYGQWSYFKPREAYRIKKRIERDRMRLASMYEKIDTDNPAKSIGKDLSNEISKKAGQGIQKKQGELTNLMDSAGPPQSELQKIAVRDLVNTYVWSADGGFFAEETETSDYVQETFSGSVSHSGGAGGYVDGTGFFVDFELSIMASGSQTQTKSKSMEKEHALKMEVELELPLDLQRYEADQSSPGDPFKVSGIYDKNGKPINQPGKVDCYRWMTFYLEPKEENHDTLFNKVIDPMWIGSDHPSAVALREAMNAEKKPPCWRVFHRVTFVSRVLPPFRNDAPASVEKEMANIDIASNWELIRRLEPMAGGRGQSISEMRVKVENAMKMTMPSLLPYKESIIGLMADYLSIEY